MVYHEETHENYFEISETRRFLFTEGGLHMMPLEELRQTQRLQKLTDFQPENCTPKM